MPHGTDGAVFGPPARVGLTSSGAGQRGLMWTDPDGAATGCGGALISQGAGCARVGEIGHAAAVAVAGGLVHGRAGSVTFREVARAWYLQPQHLPPDVDTAGLLQREITMDQAGDKLLDMMFRTADGRLTAAEALGHREFVMTRLYESA